MPRNPDGCEYANFVGGGVQSRSTSRKSNDKNHYSIVPVPIEIELHMIQVIIPSTEHAAGPRTMVVLWPHTTGATGPKT